MMIRIFHYNKKNVFLLGLVVLLLSACQAQPTAQQLGAVAFQQKIASTSDPVILDVRTPEEFSRGHIAGAVNLSWADAHFKREVSTLNKSVPVYVYCLSGARSTSAGNYLHQQGFQQVFELKDGLLAWRAASLPEVSGQANTTGALTQPQFLKLIDRKKKVLVDFYADWCAPCKKMEPYLKEISHELKETVEVVRIDADANVELCKTLGIQALPVLHVYENKKLTWSNTGYIDKAGVVKQLQ